MAGGTVNILSVWQLCKTAKHFPLIALIGTHWMDQCGVPRKWEEKRKRNLSHVEKRLCSDKPRSLGFCQIVVLVPFWIRH